MPGNDFSAAVILDLRGSIWESLQGFPTELVVSTVSASDSNLRCGKEEWPACSGSRDDDPPRPILIFVAAEKMARLQNTTTPTDASILDFRPRLENRCKLFPVYTLFRALILDFRAKLGNRCKETLKNSPKAASILDFRARLGNRCRVLPVYALLRASILDFKPRLENQCKDFPVYTLFRASILDFRPRLANRCKLFGSPAKFRV